MIDLIERQAAIDVVASFDILDGHTDKQELIYRIRQLPSAEPEIVRCKDCRHHFHDAGYGYDWCNRLGGVFRVKPDSYCSFAERRTNAV